LPDVQGVPPNAGTTWPQERETRGGAAGLRLMERSVFCDRLVFVNAVHQMQQLSDVELEVYDSWFNPIVNMQVCASLDFHLFQVEPAWVLWVEL
jgi:Deoxynucleoside kinase